jgi:hypothetical protein
MMTFAVDAPVRGSPSSHATTTLYGQSTIPCILMPLASSQFDRDMEHSEKETLVVSKCRLCGTYLIKAFANSVDYTKLGLHEWEHARSCKGAPPTFAASS